MILYKYVSPSSLPLILDSKKLRCAALSSFNDPFEGQVIEQSDPFTKEDFVAELVRQVEEMDKAGEKIPLEPLVKKENQLAASPITIAVALYQNGHFGPMSLARFVEILTSYVNDLQLLTGPNEWVYKVHQRLADEIHVLCLSENPDSLLMWAHYADHHRGAVLGFEIHDVHSFLSGAEKVRYADRFPVAGSLSSVVAGQLMRPRDMRGWLEATLLTKSSEWSYEREWRVLLRHDARDEQDLAAFPPEALREVIFGCRASNELIEIARNLLNHLPTARLRRAERHRLEFKLQLSDF